MLVAQDAVDSLYRTAVTEDKTTSTARLDTLAPTRPQSETMPMSQVRIAS